MFRLFIKIDRIKNLTLISEAAPVDLDIDCRTPVSGRICDLLLYFRRVLNGIVLFFTCMFILDLKANFKSFINMINNTRSPCSEVIRFLHCLQSKFLNIDINVYLFYKKSKSTKTSLYIYTGRHREGVKLFIYRSFSLSGKIGCPPPQHL